MSDQQTSQPAGFVDKLGHELHVGDVVSFVHFGEHHVARVAECVIDPVTKLPSVVCEVPVTVIAHAAAFIGTAREAAVKTAHLAEAAGAGAVHEVERAAEAAKPKKGGKK